MRGWNLPYGPRSGNSREVNEPLMSLLTVVTFGFFLTSTSDVFIDQEIYHRDVAEEYDPNHLPRISTIGRAVRQQSVPLQYAGIGRDSYCCYTSLDKMGSLCDMEDRRLFTTDASMLLGVVFLLIQIAPRSLNDRKRF